MSDLSAEATLAAAVKLPIHLYDDEDMHARAMFFARHLGLPASYDAHYLALADHLGAELWTADRRLANSVQPHLPWVQFVGQ